MIKRIEMENWKSHHETDLEFSSGVNALIGTMGSGKSSVLEAITFGLYGTTPALNSREITLDDAIRRSPSPAKDARVKVWLELGGDEYTVERVIERGSGTKRSELRKNSELIEAPSTQEVTEQVEKVLGMDFHSFTRAIYAEQNKLDLFLEMRPGDRKERIDELLKLDRFEDARQTIVTVENRLGDQLDAKQDEYAELEEEIDGEELEELEEDIEELEDEREELEEEVEELGEKLETQEKGIEELEEKKDKYRELEQRKTKLEARKESIEERLEEKETTESIEKPEEKKQETEERIEELKEARENISQLEQRLELDGEKREKLKKEVENLEEQVEKFQELEDIEDEIEEISGEAENVKERGTTLHAERKNLLDSLKTLKDTEGDCPTCGQEMDEEHREELFEERKSRVKELKKKEKQLRDKLEELEEEREGLTEKRDELMQYRDSGEKLEDTREELEELEEDIEDRKEKLEELSEEWSGDEVEELEQQLERLAEAEEVKELREKEEVLEEKIGDTEDELEELDFDEEKLEEMKEELSEIREEKSVKENTLASQEELLSEKRKRLEQMQERLDKLEEIEKELEKTDKLLDFVHNYKIGLEDTQVTLRERFVRRLNELMDSIWSQVYPYDDYYSIKLNAEEGYLLELLDSENNWISAEAEVSGGERHSAALVMRLALTFTLSPKLQMLILDEPTHNLDSSAVEELAETLRERTSELIEQMFVVTHDPALESAATGKLYQFEKKGTETGLTEVEEVK